jgi:hypothetical protein
MRRKGSKAKSQVRHAQRRALQRFDVFLTESDIKSIVRSIQTGDAKFAVKQSNRVSVFEVAVHDRLMYAVYDSVRQTIVTFLTDDMMRKHV